jgi:hypothetical protein
MKQLLKKILYRDIDITEYAGIAIHEPVSEKVLLKTPAIVTDVSRTHWVLCLDPLVFGVWLATGSAFPDTTEYTLLFEATAYNNKKEKKLAEVQLSLQDTIKEADGKLLLLKVEHCSLFHTSHLEAYFLFSRYYRKPGFRFDKFKSFVTAYSYPRKVRVVSFQKEDYYNIFPMDLLGRIKSNNRFVFGLRHTNQALSRIIEEKKIVVSEVPFIHKPGIYKLGSHHSSTPPPLNQLPFKTMPSKDFGFPVTEWAENYNEIRITRTINLGSHMLLWGVSQHEEIIRPATEHFYHIHFLLYLHQKRQARTYRLA